MRSAACLAHRCDSRRRALVPPTVAWPHTWTVVFGAGSHGVDNLPAVVRLLLLLLSRCALRRALALDDWAGAQLWQIHRAKALIYRSHTDRATSASTCSSCAVLYAVLHPDFLCCQVGTCGAVGAWRHACHRAFRCAAPPLSRLSCMLCTCQRKCRMCAPCGNALVACPTPSRHASFQAQNPKNDYPRPQACRTSI